MNPMSHIFFRVLVLVCTILGKVLKNSYVLKKIGLYISMTQVFEMLLEC